MVFLWFSLDQIPLTRAVSGDSPHGARLERRTEVAVVRDVRANPQGVRSCLYEKFFGRVTRVDGGYVYDNI